jgi:hypothetical protein
VVSVGDTSGEPWGYALDLGLVCLQVSGWVWALGSCGVAKSVGWGTLWRRHQSEYRRTTWRCCE